MKIELKEIIWEFTLACNKNCSYCGSKKALTDISEDAYSNYEMITNRILDYHQQNKSALEVNFSGGEPATRYESLMTSAIALKNAGIEVKVLTNGLLFDKLEPKHEDVFSAIGWSINTKEDAQADLHNQKLTPLPITIITNFGKHNIWEFETIAEKVKQYKAWQVQLTIGGDFMLPTDGIEHLWKKLEIFSKMNPNIQVIYADNLQVKHECQAGWASMGILADGTCVPCLSMRSWSGKLDKWWKDNADEHSKDAQNIWKQHSLQYNSLKDIWQNGAMFQATRFEDCKNCRSCFTYPEESKSQNFCPSSLEDLAWPKNSGTYIELNPPRMDVMAYAVINPGTVAVWSNTSGIPQPGRISGVKQMVYGVYKQKSGTYGLKPSIQGENTIGEIN